MSINFLLLKWCWLSESGFGILTTCLQIQDRAGGTDIIFYLVIQIAVILPADGKNTGNPDTFSYGQTTGKFQFIRAGIITSNYHQSVVLQPDMNFNIWFFFS